MYTQVSNTPVLRPVVRHPALPRRGQTYTLREILGTLELHDSPHLNITLDGVRGVIQNGHVTDEQLLTVPGMAETTWRYLYTTDEWIPIFNYAGPLEKISACVDYEPDIDGRGWWITPKGCPRQQYGAW